MVKEIGIRLKTSLEQREVQRRLNESEEKYRLIYENANDLIRVLNEKFEFEYINEKVHKRILGYSNDDILGLTHLPFLHPDDRRNAIRSTVRNLKKGEGSYQARFLDKSGNYKWFEFSGTIFFNSKGEKKILSIARDISERKKAELRLKESEERYRLISQNADENLFIFDMNLNTIYHDPNVPNILGYTNDEISKLKLPDYNEPSSLKILLKAYKEELRNERKKNSDPNRIRSFEIDQIHKNGSIVNVEVKFTFLRDNKGIAKGIISLTRDISKRKQAEKKLKDSEEKFRLIAEKTSIGICIIENEDLKYLNRAFGEIHEYTVEEMYKRTMNDLIYQIHPDDIHLVREKKMLRETGDRSIHRFLFRIITKSGKIKWLDNVSKVIQYNGRDSLLSTITDITEIKEIEKKLKESEKQYHESYNRANFYKDLFAHDINNILQIITSSAELISIQLGDSEKSKILRNLTKIISQQVERGGKLVMNVHTLSKLEEENVIFQPIKIDETLRKSIEFVEKSYEDRQLNILVYSTDSNFKVQANLLLQDVFENILINSVKYNENHNVDIIIRISKVQIDNAESIKIEFSDNGVGVPDDRKGIIFKRGNRELKGGKGMGLGLSLVSKIISSFNGKIWVENKVEGDYTKGSKFIIELSIKT